MTTLHELAQRRGAGELQDTKFMSATEKARVLKQWERFLRGGLKCEQFDKALYNHLIQHCSFIAHYDRAGFYSTYFESGDTIRQFLSQFDDRCGIPASVEYGMTYWIAGGNDAAEQYYDINCEMVRIAGKYIPTLELKAKNDQRHADLAHAEVLLKKHGLSLPGGDK